MTFTYTYRNKAGAKEQCEIGAQNRTEAFAQLKARGIVPLTLHEGRSRSPRGTLSVHRFPVWGWGVLSGVAVLAVAATWWLWPHAEIVETPPAEVAPKAKPKRPPEPSKPIRRKEALKPVVEAVPVKAPETNYFDKVRADLAKVRERMKTASDYSYYNLERKARDLEKLLTDEKMQFHTTNHANVVNQPFKTCTEQVLDWVFNCEVGGDPPPFVPPLDPGEMANIGEILDRANEVLEGDSEEVAARKVMVERAKKELKEYLAQGGNAADFLHFYYNELQNAYELRLEASKTVRQFAHNSDPETARKYLEATNKELAKKGIAPVMLSDKTKTRLGLPVEEEGEKK